MKITDAKVIVCSPGRNFVTLKIYTDQGVYGLGDATLNGRELAVATYLKEYCIPALIGKDPRNIEDIWHYFYRGVYWKRGAVTMTAISAIDMALWDIKGKMLNTPLYNLLGGKSRDRVMVYAHANGVDLDHALESVAHEIDQGFKAIRVQSGIPGLDHTYGVAKKGEKYEPAGKGLAKEDFWDTHKYLNWSPKLFSKVREHFGEDPLLLHDVHHRLTPIEAGRLGKELEPFHLYWMEDAVTGELQEGLQIVRQHTTTPIAIGEVFNSVYDYTTLISKQLIDFVRMPIVHGGGITHLQKVAAFASIYHVQTGFHGATDLSPINMAAALHFDFAINNFGIQEYMPHEKIVGEVFKTNYKFEDGYMYIDDTPGIGVDMDEKAAEKFPYDPASLPVNRKADGTLFYW
ncbi:D-mannonate dehydratase ManD [Marinilabilia salmonicolor]|jgi:mannonate dehydratase|uniref:D-mannonate dehydratase n=1 Tax=Marinilabilia salmonicolor TaxID=989 RepID=A0A368V4Q8_9BACT|nr:D-mannonate dehydratase ManD [Marinilabilia salmonicolor]RCW36072.1 D-mannonate dehydratase [Marinilabilia salmonicolor]